MTRTLKVSLLSASMLVVLWATTSDACHRRRAAAPATNCYSGYTYASPAGCYTTGGGYSTAQGGYYGGGYAGGTAGYPGGYDFGRPGYNPGGLGGPRSGPGCGPAWASAASARGAERPQVLRSPRGTRRPGPTGSLGAAVR